MNQVFFLLFGNMLSVDTFLLSYFSKEAEAADLVYTERVTFMKINDNALCKVFHSLVPLFLSPFPLALSRSSKLQQST